MKAIACFIGAFTGYYIANSEAKYYDGKTGQLIIIGLAFLGAILYMVVGTYLLIVE